MGKYWITILLLVPIMAGCQGWKSPTQKEQATLRWNQARANVLYGLANDQYSNGNLDKSRETVTEAAKLDPNSPTIHILSAKLAIEAGQLELAERELDTARKLDPSKAEADYLSGVIYQRWEQPQRAYEYYDHACQKAPADLSYLMAKAEMLVALDKPVEALALLQDKVAYFEHSAMIRDAVGLLLIQQGKYDDAVDMLQRGSIMAPDDLTIREHLSTALYHDGRYHECADLLVHLVKEDGYKQRADLLMTLGECQMQIGRAGDARTSFQGASDLLPESVAVWLSYAKAAMQLGDNRRVEICLNKAMALNPSNSETYLMLGYLRLRESRNAEALVAFRQAGTLDPTDIVSLCLSGYALEKSGKTKEAAEIYAQALKIKPGDELASRLMARLDSRQ